MYIRRIRRIIKERFHHSLFIRLLLSFLVIILMLASFHVFSISMFQDKMQGEIIKYNNQSLWNTTGKYENHFQLIEKMIVDMYFDEKITILKQNLSIDNFKQINLLSQQIIRIKSNDQLYINEIVTYFEGSSKIIDKEGLSEAEAWFAKQMISDQYSPGYWKEQVAQTSRFSVYPAAEFQRISMEGNSVSSGKLFPIIYRSYLSKDLVFMVLLDADKLYEKLHESSDDHFYILDDQGNLLFASNPNWQPSTEQLSKFAALKEGHELEQKDYYFFRKGSLTGLTYVNVIPNETIASQAQRMNIELLFSLAIILVISVVLSVILSVKFNSPMKRIIDAIRKQKSGVAVESGIHEYNILGDHIDSMMQANKEIRSDLLKKKSMLESYDYIKKLKNIYIGVSDGGKEIGQENRKPYFLVIFSIAFTREFHILDEVDQARATYYMSEMIQLNLSESFPDSVTIQTENSLILSLINMEVESKFANVWDKLKELQNIFDRESEYCYLTIAVRPKLRNITEFATAYEETLEMLQQRKPLAETQLITEIEPAEYFILFTAALVQELHARLQAGESDNAMQVVRRMFNQLVKKEANIYQYMHLSREIMDEVLKMMVVANLDYNNYTSSESPYRRLKLCVIEEDYLIFFEETLQAIAPMFQNKISTRDQLKESILNYMHHHYAEELSLEAVAEKFHLSSGYLSVYFKEKTGDNFLHYLHNLRLSKAKELLTQTDMKINDISAMVGYQSSGTFIRLFKKVVGVPPGEFRRTNLLIE